MAAFRYEAVDAGGRLTRGRLEADTPRAARDTLRARGLTPTLVAPTRGAFDVAGATRLASAEVTSFTRQWSTLVQSGMPLDQALTAIAEQADSPRVVDVANALRRAVEAGESLSQALSRFPRTFTPLYRGLVAAGTESGALPAVLSRLADHLEARQALRQRVGVALVYPMLVTIVALAVVGVLLVYVVPQIVGVYQQSRQTLPALTRMLIATSAFLQSTGWLWVVLAIVAVAVLTMLYRGARFRTRVHAFVLSLPAFGRLARSLDTARFASTLSILVGGGAPLLRAMDAAAEVVRLHPLADAARRAASLVREGVPLARALKEQRVFPPVLVHLVANGEATGRLPAMLDRAAGELERDAETRLAWLTALLQPALIVVMGAIVLVLVLAVMLPIVSMNQLIR